MTGQESVNVAETFNTQLEVTGLLLSKIDGDARGGAALSVREAVGKPIKFISTGEKLDNLETFYPDRMASRILDMGDVLSLVEKAQQNIDEKEAERVAMEMLKGDFTLDMFVQMQSMMKKMGNMGDIMKMMGLGGMFGISTEQQKQIAEQGEKMMSQYEIAINSMTPDERKNPDLIDFQRKRRIAKGSGLKEAQIGQLLNEFQKMRQMFQYLKPFLGGGMGGMGGGGFPGMGNFPGMPPMGGMGGGMQPPPGFDPSKMRMPPGMPGMPGMPGGAKAKGGGKPRLRKKKRK